MTPNEWLPAQSPFEMVRRGFAPDQVMAHLERLEYDLRIATANREATNQRVSELSAQLAAAQSEADTLRGQLDRNALEPVSMTGLSDRMQRMIRLAEEEAGEIRARAETETAEKQAELDKALSEAAENRRTFDAERERTRSQLAEQVQLLTAEATEEAENTRSSAQEESARLLSEANTEAHRTVTEARETAGKLLGDAIAESDDLLVTARAEAERLTSTARTEAERLTSTATAEAEQLSSTVRAEVERLETESAERRTGIEDDFEITMAARRSEAHKVLADREHQSTEDAERRVREATAQATALVAEATKTANQVVNDADVEANRRVTAADEAVQRLTELRTAIVDQLAGLGGHLDHLRELAAKAPTLVDPPEQEEDRPRATDFPLPAGPAGSNRPDPDQTLTLNGEPDGDSRSSAEAGTTQDLRTTRTAAVDGAGSGATRDPDATQIVQLASKPGKSGASSRR